MTPFVPARQSQGRRERETLNIGIFFHRPFPNEIQWTTVDLGRCDRDGRVRGRYADYDITRSYV